MCTSITSAKPRIPASQCSSDLSTGTRGQRPSPRRCSPTTPAPPTCRSTPAQSPSQAPAARPTSPATRCRAAHGYTPRRRPTPPATSQSSEAPIVGSSRTAARTLVRQKPLKCVSAGATDCLTRFAGAELTSAMSRRGTRPIRSDLAGPARIAIAGNRTRQWRHGQFRNDARAWAGVSDGDLLWGREAPGSVAPSNPARVMSGRVVWRVAIAALRRRRGVVHLGRCYVPRSPTPGVGTNSGAPSARRVVCAAAPPVAKSRTAVERHKGRSPGGKY